ncbi:diguanylate cyclase [Ideonella sp.]|uniref:GGDEF domain-containing protein n=1 Tax=Ideonella sp. TaxID=1929293 RepID=UPI003BB5EC1E
MDARTIIFLLASQLLLASGLLYLIGRRLPAGGGVGAWALGLALFGLAYVGVLVLGVQSPWRRWLGVDLAMVMASGLFVVGLQQYVDARAWPARRLLLAGLAFVLLQSILVAQLGVSGQHLALNGCLGLAYGLLALHAWRHRNHLPGESGPALSALAAIVGLLSALTLARAVQAAVFSPDTLYDGLPAEVYYAFAVVAALLISPMLLWMVFIKLAVQLAALANRDALTRCLNRSGLDDVLNRHFAARVPQPLCLLAVDVDHFKRINDLHGHAAGDAVLREVAASLQGHLRAEDLVARIGGEEFMVVGVGLDQGDALRLAERLRAAVQALRVLVPNQDAALQCTISLGVSRPFASHDQFMAASQAADRALYAAKAAGRNRVERVA